MRFRGTCYRGHDAKWAFSPLSGEGARRKGGRFNPVGRDALYLALTVEGLFLEQGHGLAHRFDPLTVCSYDVNVADIVDLRTAPARAKAGVTIKQLSCPWALDCRRSPTGVLDAGGEAIAGRRGGTVGAVLRARRACRPPS